MNPNNKSNQGTKLIMEKGKQGGKNQEQKEKFSLNSVLQLQNKIVKKTELISFSKPEINNITDLLSKIPLEVQLEGNYLSEFRPPLKKEDQNNVSSEPLSSTNFYTISQNVNPSKDNSEIQKKPDISNISEKNKTSQKSVQNSEKTVSEKDKKSTKDNNDALFQKADKPNTKQNMEKTQQTTKVNNSKEQDTKANENLDEWLDDLLG